MSKMAAARSASPGEDDEAWLYGGDNKKDPPAPGTVSDGKSGLSADAAPFKPKDSEAGEVEDEEPGETKDAAEASDNNEDDDDDDDDDDIQITIGDIKPNTFDTPRNLAQKGYQRGGASVTPAGKPTGKGVDLETTGNINGVSAFEFDLDSLQAEDKPWRKPGADITDYFNYGFNEDTWKQYCERQRRLRMENNVKQIYSSSVGVPVSSSTKSERVSESSISSIGTTVGAGMTPPGKRPAGPPPARKLGGTIDVIGSTARDSRRPFRDDADAPPDFKKPYVPTPDFSQPPPTHIPPPTVAPPPMDFPPPATVVPPPGVPPPHIPPPGVPPPTSMPPPGFRPPDPYDPFYPPPGGPPDRSLRMGRYSPPPGFDDRPPYRFDPYGGGYGGGPPPGWDGRGPPPPGGYGGPNWNSDSDSISDSETHSSEDERERRLMRDRDYDRGRDRGRERDRSRDYHRRDRSRSRSRERERSRSVRDRERGDRDRSREHRDRERSRRKKKDERRGEDERKHRSSSHSSSKRSSSSTKKEEEHPPPAAEETASPIKTVA